MSREYLVSLEIFSDSLALDELSLLLGRPASVTSHDKDELRRGRQRWGRTLWKLESDLPEAASVEEHIQRIASRFRPRDLIAVLP